MPGKLIIIEGSDASGKQTQSRLLVERLEKESSPSASIAFPRYDTFFGKLVKKYLDGELGGKDSMPAEVPSLLYALDRFDASPLIQKMLSENKIVICDRYTASNIAHQAAKLPKETRPALIEWIKQVESSLPVPTLTIYLDVPVEFSQKLMEQEGRKKDLHEQDVHYLKAVREIYLNLASQPGWVKIDCVSGGRLLAINEIHELIWEKSKAYF